MCCVADIGNNIGYGGPREECSISEDGARTRECAIPSTRCSPQSRGDFKANPGSYLEIISNNAVFSRETHTQKEMEV